MSENKLNIPEVQHEHEQQKKKRGRPRKYETIEEYREAHNKQFKEWYKTNKETYLKKLKEKRDSGEYYHYHLKNPDTKRNMINKIKLLEQQLSSLKQV